jgi:hypothetical protein
MDDAMVAESSRRCRPGSRWGVESTEEVNQMADKKIAPKAATSSKASSGTDKAATRVTKKQSHKKVTKKQMGK